MGMFDYVKYNGKTWQTKSLACLLDTYEVTQEGQLLEQHYDIVDRSDPNAEGINRLWGMLSRENITQEPSTYTGEVRMVANAQDDDEEAILFFRHGKLLKESN